MKKKGPYWYDLSGERIAKSPAVPRDSNKLLVYDTRSDSLSVDYFYHLDSYLEPSSVITLNDSRVVPVRVELHKQNGGKVVVLFLINEWINDTTAPIPCFFDRKGSIGENLYFNEKSFVTVQSQDKALFYVSWTGRPEALISLLEAKGVMPIPPYIKNTPLSRDELLEQYQTIFAKKQGSSAAPTASLHFTQRVFEKLEKKGIQKTSITLHVGMGTFAPLTEKNLRENKLHNEWYEVTEETSGFINTSKKEGKKIIAVGTTVVRTLESVAKNKTLNGKTDLFIQPPYKFAVVDGLITNFHLPGSSLMMLVDAFLEYKQSKRRILELYDFAIKNDFMFYSFGDAMLIL